MAPGTGRPKQHSNSIDLVGSEGPSGRASRGGYYTSGGPGRSRQHSNSAESLDGIKGSRELVPYGGGPGVGVRAKHSCSADSLLEGPPRPARDRDGRVGGGSLGKSSSLPQNNMIVSKIGGQDDGRAARKWRPSIAVQVGMRKCETYNAVKNIFHFMEFFCLFLCFWSHLTKLIKGNLSLKKMQFSNGDSICSLFLFLKVGECNFYF